MIKLLNKRSIPALCQSVWKNHNEHSNNILTGNNSSELVLINTIALSHNIQIQIEITYTRTSKIILMK